MKTLGFFIKCHLMKTLVSLILLTLCLSLKAQNAHFSWSAEAKNCMRLIQNLEIKKAETSIKQIKEADPNNMVCHLLENYIDLFTILIKESPEYLEENYPNKSKRIEALEALPDSNPYKAFTQAEIKIHWAMARMRFEEYFAPALDINRAFKQLRRLQEKFPYFYPAQKTLGTLYVAVGSIPSQYRSLLGFISALEGDVNYGFELLEQAYKHGIDRNTYVYREETGIIYAYLLLYIKKDKEEAWKVTSKLNLRTSESILAKFLKANVALRTFRTQEAINILQAPYTGKADTEIHFLDFMLGEAYLYQLDPKAITYFEKYIQQFEGKNYVKEALQKQAWAYLVNEDKQAYQANMLRILNEGEAYSATDKSAEVQAKLGKTPNIHLLKARLLCDGGYFSKAKSILLKGILDPNQLQDLEQLEFHYRQGRIAHLSGSHTEAKKQYQKTIDLGKNNKAYFACRSALEMGHIFEEEKNKPKASEYFTLCLDLEPDEYKFSLHLSAKAGLKRL